MKYAEVCKDQHAWTVLVRFKTTAERAEQQLRFSYEFPSGTFIPMTWKDCRKKYDIRHYSDWTPKLEVELCGGRTFPAIVTAEGYTAMKVAEVLENFEQGYEQGMSMDDFEWRWGA